MKVMNNLFKKLDKDLQEKLIKKEQDKTISPMLATLTHEYFSDAQWIYERKLDGERCILHKKGNAITLMSRNHKKQNEFYPEICKALEKFSGNFILDSELVAFDGKRTSFAMLQNRMHVKNPGGKLIKKYPVYAYVFDIIYLDGYGLEELPLRKRKSILRAAFEYKDPIRYLPHRNEKGEAYFQQACENGWEGVIAKDAESKYLHDRSKKWLKFKCEHGQEFVVGGYTDPKGERIGFGALLLGYYEDEELIYCGRVGTGFDDDFLEFLHNRMRKIKTESSPFTDCEESGDDINWVKPELVVEVRFTEWTDKGKLRHPRFLGLRKDKEPKDVHREDKEIS